MSGMRWVCSAATVMAPRPVGGVGISAHMQHMLQLQLHPTVCLTASLWTRAMCVRVLQAVNAPRFVDAAVQLGVGANEVGSVRLANHSLEGGVVRRCAAP